MTSKSCYLWFVDLCHVFYWYFECHDVRLRSFDSKLWRESNWILVAMCPDCSVAIFPVVQGWAQIGVIEKPRSWASTIPSLFQKNMVSTEIFDQLCDPRPTLSFLSLSYKVISASISHSCPKIFSNEYSTPYQVTKIPWNLHTPYTYNCWFIMGLQPPLQKLCAGLRKKGCRHQSTLQQHGEALEQQVSVTCSWKMHHFPKHTHRTEHHMASYLWENCSKSLTWNGTIPG